MRARDLTFRSAAILLLLTVGAILVMGYHPGAEDDFVYLPAIKRDLNPALFPRDADFFRLQLQATVFDKVVAASVKLTHAPLNWALFAWQAAAIFLVLLGCLKIVRRCFVEEHARWCAVALVAALLTLPVAGTSLFVVDQHLHPRTLATAFVLFAISAVLDRRYGRAALFAVIALAFHPIMGAFGTSYCVFLGWPFEAGKAQGPASTDKASSAAALRVHGLFHCLSHWLSFRRQRRTATRTATAVAVGAPRCARNDKSQLRMSVTRIGLSGVLLSVLPFGVFIPLGWIFEQPSAAWREAAATRDYYFLGRQEWYEWLGTLAPFVLLWAFSKIGKSGDLAIGSSGDGNDVAPVVNGATALSRICRRLIWYGLFQLAVTLVIMLPPSLERWRTLQPLRYLHLLYLLMLLAGGGLLGKYVLKAKAWRWAVLFVPIVAGMFWAQREEFPATAHIEFGAGPHGNVWEQAFDWVRTNTPVNAYFALGPHYYAEEGEDWHSFRALGERSQLADALKDPSVSTQVPRLAARWQRESHAQDGWDNFQAGDFERLKREFGVDWVVLDHQVAGLICPFVASGENGVQVRVCRIP